MHGKSLPKGKARKHGVTAPGAKRARADAGGRHPELAPPGHGGRPEGFTSRGKQRQHPSRTGLQPDS